MYIHSIFTKAKTILFMFLTCWLIEIFTTFYRADVSLFKQVNVDPLLIRKLWEKGKLILKDQGNLIIVIFLFFSFSFAGDIRQNTFSFLKLMSVIFYQILIFSPNDSLSKTVKCFLFHLKSSFCSWDIKIFVFFPFFSTLSRFKRTNGSGIINDVMH